MTTHYYDKKQTSDLREKSIEVNGASFLTASGLFSKDHIDNATKLLINKCQIEDAQDILDLGCGWGAVAILLKKKYPAKEFMATDVVDRAVAYTKKNMKLNRVDIKVKQSDILEKVEREFDCILTNPPYVAGRKICYAFIEQSFAHLKTGGSLQLVARHQKGGKMLGLHMEEIFGNCEPIAKAGGFRIYKSTKNQ